MNQQGKEVSLSGPLEDFTPDPSSLAKELGGIKLGDIATSLYWSRGGREVQGRVYRIDPTDEYPIALQIYSENSWILGCEYDPEKVNLIYCKLGQLKVDEVQQWDVTALYQRRFRHMSHTLRTPDLSKIDITLCAHNACDEKSVQWILFNLVGTVYQLYVCQEHAKLHGLCSEDFPFQSRQLNPEAVAA